jgi:cell division septal protein FtsQ
MKERKVIHTQYRPVYRRGNDQIKPVRRLKLPNLNWRLVGLGSLILVLLIGWWQLFHLNTVKIQGNTSLTTKQVTAMVQAELKKSLGRQNLTSLDTAGLEKALLTDNYQLKSVDIVRNWPHGLTVNVSERQPSLIWKTGDQAYLLDADGSIISPVSLAGTKLPVITDSTNLPVKVGDKVVPPRFVTFCAQLVQAMSQTTGVGITGMTVPDTTTEVYVTTNKGYVVKFDTTRSAEEGLAQMQRVLTELQRQGKNPAEYIDLRIENKAYYK